MKITPEMRIKLRQPLPPEAVSQHPTKAYMSSIKLIYVTERINDVFGIGTWTLKSEPIDSLDKMVVGKAVMEIPEYEFYGEAYGGNDNADKGDAYKGAVTDALTKIAGQQLEIGIDVFKGLHGQAPKPEASKTEHWCELHQTNFFMKGKMKAYAHPIGDTGQWCNEHTEDKKPEPEKSQPEPAPDHAVTATESTTEGSTEQSGKYPRDPESLKNTEQLCAALKKDFGLAIQQQWDKLKIKDWNDLAIGYAEAYIQVAASRL